MSTWLNANGTQGAGIMAPSNALAQLEFYTNSNFRYIAISDAETSEILWNFVKDNNITYIMLSEHFLETVSFAAYSIIPNDDLHYSIIFTYW